MKQVIDFKRRPDFMSILEIGNDKTKSSFRDLKFGYPNKACSFENDKTGDLLQLGNQRGCCTFHPDSSQFTPSLNIYPEIICLNEILQFTTGRNRHRSLKIAIIAAYRNHAISIATFKKWIEDILDKNVRLGTCEFILYGDFNCSSIKFKNLLERHHIGFHKHRQNSAPKLIDKIFVSQRIMNLGVEVQVMNSVETVANETNGLGHKAFLVAIKEKISSGDDEISCFKSGKFRKCVRSTFNDEFTNNLLSSMGRIPLQPIEHLSNKNFEPISEETYTTRYFDPASLITEELVKIMPACTVKKKKSQPFHFRDLVRNAAGNTVDKVKKFSRQCKFILNSVCTDNPLLTHSVDATEKPSMDNLCKHLSTKLNKCHRGDPDFMDEFADSIKIAKRIDPTDISMEDLNKALKNIKGTKTPWIRGIAPFHFLEAAKSSNNFKKCVLAILNRCTKEGKLAMSMNHDSVIFLHKKGDRKDSKNYRPISVDHPLTKILCEILNKKTIKHMNGFRNPLNFSYVAGKSTMTAILTASLITEEITKRGNIPIIIATDMSGAFETTQSTLIKKCLDKTILDGNLRTADTLIKYMTEKVIFGKKENGDLIEVFREDKLIGSGQGSKSSPNLFLIQASSATFGLSRQKALLLTKINGQDIFCLVYADDNFMILEVLPGLAPGTARLPQIRKIVDDFMYIWEFEVKMSGMIINETKTEILAPGCPNDENYPPIRSTIKWLGMNITFGKGSTLIADTKSNLQMIKAKTWSKFQQLCVINSDITLRLRAFTMFMEPILDYSLLDAVTAGPKKFNKVVHEYQVLQNGFLRSVAQVGCYSKITELHEILGIKTVESKVINAAVNEWEKVDRIKNYTPDTRHSRNGLVHIIDGVKSNFWKIAKCFPKPKSVDKFDINKFNEWKKSQDRKIARIQLRNAQQTP